MKWLERSEKRRYFIWVYAQELFDLAQPLSQNIALTGKGLAGTMDQALYRMSGGHGWLTCSACHDGPHAIAPSREANDGLKFLELQGELGTLRECTVCHAMKPDQMFKHSY